MTAQANTAPMPPVRNLYDSLSESDKRQLCAAMTVAIAMLHGVAQSQRGSDSSERRSPYENV